MARVSDRDIPLLPNKESRIRGVRFNVIFVGDLAYLGTMEVLTHVVMNVTDLKPCKIGIFVDANGSVKCVALTKTDGDMRRCSPARK